MRKLSLACCLILSFFLQSACSPESTNPTPTGTYTFELVPSDFVSEVDNPYFPLIPGTKWVYLGHKEDTVERVEVEVLSETRLVMGITAVVVRDTVYIDHKRVEETLDWYAQDAEGNVWYLGNDDNNYENGQVVNKEGSWEAGVDGALPGIIMYSDPAASIGEVYRQEYYPGEAEDVARIVSVSKNMSFPDFQNRSFDEVLVTNDYTPLEPDQLENKYYVKGIGFIKEVDANTGEVSVLVRFTEP
jgi:hypothetical protein